MSIFKKKSKVSPQMFTLTFYIALLGFLFGSFGLGIGLLNSVSLRHQKEARIQSDESLRRNLSQLYYCQNFDLKPCNGKTVADHRKAQ